MGWVRDVANGVVHRAWEWASLVGTVGPQDARGRRFRSMGASACIAFPPGAIFGERWITIGANTLIGPNVSLSAGMPIDWIDPDRAPIVEIGARCNIGRGSSIVGHDSIVIGDDVTTGPNVYITDQNHDYADTGVPIGVQWPITAPVCIGSGCWLGTGAVVLPGAQIGRNVTVAAGSVVRGVVPDYSVVAGVPGKVVRKFEDGEWTPPLDPRPIPPEGWPSSFRD